ncbi:ecotin family protein [Rickettsia rhipicephali]|uniref:ecotin family protein n=1 Tax=Rickettsia rhipicephali TaxID=33992 RepID=UPI0002FE2CF1|nr:ecotin family protein [Rickettsia rhipicephali]
MHPISTPLENQKRYVIHLPTESNEEKLKVELQATKNAMPDCVIVFGLVVSWKQKL